MVRSFFYLPGLRARSGKFFLSGCAGPARLVNFFSSSCGLAPGRKKSLYYMLFFSVRPWYQARANFFYLAQLRSWPGAGKNCAYIISSFFFWHLVRATRANFFFCSGAAAPEKLFTLDSCTGILGKFRDM
jgi:hypothetical protein